MEKLISKQGRIGYRYDEGERPDFDAFIDRLSKFGPSKDYFYGTVFELREVTDNFDYGSYDKERVERLGYPADRLRRCGLLPDNMKNIPDEAIVSHCETLRTVDETISLSKIVFTSLDIPENTPFDSSVLDYDNAPLYTNGTEETKRAEEDNKEENKKDNKKENIFTKISKFFTKGE
ncbi:MAG: hypothetical protein IJL89_09245 [Firmicutes bacterium]|nr:hypothetical protein [Bacillota bacterium]